jgi:hypothetical protein
MNQTENPSWYFIIDGVIMASSLIGLMNSLIFLVTVIAFRRQCYSAVNVIASNIQVAIFVSSFINLFSIVSALKGDLFHSIQFDSWCVWRSYFMYGGIANIYYSFVIQSFYGFLRVMYPAKARYSSVRLLCVMILVEWILTHGLMLFLPLGNFIHFEINSGMCFVPLSDYRIIWLMTIFIYMPPFNLIACVYLRLALFVKRSRTRSFVVNTVNARRELELIKRMVLVLSIFSVSAIPYSIYAILAFAKESILPIYQYRIIVLFNAMALAVASITILLQTSTVRQTIVSRIISREKHRVQPILLTTPHVQIPMR